MRIVENLKDCLTNLCPPSRWANYQGIKEGPVKNPFKPRLF